MRVVSLSPNILSIFLSLELAHERRANCGSRADRNSQPVWPRHC